MGSQSADESALANYFRECSIFPELGLCKLDCGTADEASVREFLNLISKFAAERRLSKGFKIRQEGVADVQASAVNWVRRSHEGIFPFYIEALIVKEDVAPGVGSSLPIAQQFPGTWLIGAQVFDSGHEDYINKHQDKWQAWVRAGVTDGGHDGGLSFNVLEVPGSALAAGNVDVRPLTMHALSPDGRGVDRGDTAAQAAIANAFWQTFWATGATRAERGNVFPVAFLPVDRSSKFEFAEPFHERYVSLRRRLFGRSAIVGNVLEALTTHKALLYDSNACAFKVAAGFEPVEAGVTSADVLLAINELNRTGFIDAYTGENQDDFQQWAEQEERISKGEPWPYGSGDWNSKVKAAGHGISDALARIRSAAGDQSNLAVIHRVVPYAGCAFLYQVMSDMDRLKERGKVQDFDGELLGATNSTFFLNFPEEYSALHSAMNEPVSLLVEEGKTRQIRTFRRAAFVLSKDGEAFITTRAGNRLKSDVLVFEGESASTNYFEKAGRSFRDNRFGPLFFGAVVVGNSLVETFEEIATEVPPAGWLTGDSEAFGGRIEPADAAEVQVRRSGELKEVPVRHAFAIGPLLMEGGKIIPLEKSREEFRSIEMKQGLRFEETSVLPRTQLPEALLDCAARGAPPTRFPYDWNITRAPRSAIGVKDDGTVIVAVVDGRADVSHSVGATLAELAEIMRGLGCRDAMNMDGGGSSVMFVNAPEARDAKLRPDLRDGIVSLPSDMGGVERLLPVPLVVCTRSK